MSLTKSSIVSQKVHLPAALASLNNIHIFDLRTCCVGVKSLSRLSLVLGRPLHPCSATWWSSLIVNLSSTVSGRTPIARAKAHLVANHYCVAAMTLAHSFIWPCNNFVLSHCTSSFLVSPSLASRNSWGASWAYAPLVWIHWPESSQLDWPPSAHSWPSPWSTWVPPQM